MKQVLFSTSSLVALCVFALWLIILLTAKRRKATTLTFAALWQRVLAKPAKRSPKAKWKRIISMLLSLLIIFLASHFLWAIFAPMEGEEESRTPIDLIAIIDTSPSTLRERASGKINLERLIDLAFADFDQLERVDRGWFYWRSRGQVLSAGPYRGGKLPDAERKRLRKLIEVDFQGLGNDAYLQAFRESQWQSVPWQAGEDLSRWPQAIKNAEKPRERQLALYSDHDLAFLGMAEDQDMLDQFDFAHTHTRVIGAHGFDYRFTHLEYTADGKMRIEGNFSESLSATYEDESAIPSNKLEREGNRLTIDTQLPAGRSTILISLDSEGDALPANNSLRLLGRPEQSPYVDVNAPNSFLSSGLVTLFRRIVPSDLTQDLRSNFSIQSDATLLVVENTDFGVSAETTQAVIYFGTLPKRYKVSTSPIKGIKAARGMLKMPPVLVGEEDQILMHNVEIKSAELPMYPAEGEWEVLLELEDVGPIVAFSRAYEVPILHIVPEFLSSNIWDQPALPLLIRRWISPMLLPRLSGAHKPELYRNGDVLPFPFRQADVSLKPLSTHFAPRHWKWKQSAEGRGFGETWIPGSYHAFDTSEQAEGGFTIDAQWLVDANEIPSAPIAGETFTPLSLAEYKPATPLIPPKMLAMLFILLICLLVLEWALHAFALSE